MPASSRVAVVTGANKGIGYHVAKQLISSGLFGHVVLACRDATRGTKAASELGGSFLPLDVGEASSRAAFVEALTTKYGRLDCLVNNAATAYKNADPTPFAEQTEPTLRVNFHGTLDVTERLLPLLLHPDAVDPRIVSVASMAGRLGQVSPELQKKFASPSLGLAELRGLVGQFESAVASGTHARQGWGKSNYGMSKLAVIAATRVLAREHPSIKVNCCCPGYCDTDMTSHKGPRPPSEGARNAVVLVTTPRDAVPTGAFYQNEWPSQW